MIISQEDLQYIEARINESANQDDPSDDYLISVYIERNPHRPWDEEARLSRYGVPIWAIIAYTNAVDGDLSQVAEDYVVPYEAVIAAIRYYARHKDSIDARILANAPSSLV